MFACSEQVSVPNKAGPARILHVFNPSAQKKAQSGSNIYCTICKVAGVVVVAANHHDFVCWVVTSDARSGVLIYSYKLDSFANCFSYVFKYTFNTKAIIYKN